MAAGHYNCPFCNRAQILTAEAVSVSHARLQTDKSKYSSDLELRAHAVICANEECKEVSLRVRLVKVKGYQAQKTTLGEVKEWGLLPASGAKPQPDYIPSPLVQDYEEACAIRDLSPKASATLARRCIQGMIRDFCGISKNRLIDEIRELRELFAAGKAPSGVHEDTLVAIDHVREIGNIGAHMEMDINVIVDVDPNEAQTLINLIELLFEEWYVARHTRSQKLAALMKVADSKKLLKTDSSAAKETA